MQECSELYDIANYMNNLELESGLYFTRQFVSEYDLARLQRLISSNLEVLALVDEGVVTFVACGVDDYQAWKAFCEGARRAIESRPHDVSYRMRTANHVEDLRQHLNESTGSSFPVLLKV